MKKKLESVMARLKRLCSEDDGDAAWDEHEHERWTGLVEWVFEINPTRSHADSPLVLLGRLGITERCPIIASAPRTMRNVRGIFRPCLEWWKISGTPSSTIRFVAMGFVRPSCH